MLRVVGQNLLLPPRATPLRCIRTMSKARTALEEMGDKGAFKRQESVFRNQVAKGSRFEPEAGRYHLYVSLACPWASRCVAGLYLKGLEESIGLSVTHPTWQRTRPDSPDDTHAGWTFASPGDAPFTPVSGHGSVDCAGCVPDPHYHAKNVRQLYELAEDTFGKYTVPILWDTKEKTIVNNESSEILRIFNSAFNDVATKPELDLYPEDLRAKIDEVNDWVYTYINNGVYRCGFATSQEAYEEAFRGLFEHLDKAEALLSKQRYLAGERFTEADLRLFVTLIRFDEVYVVYFKTNKKAIHEYPNLCNHTRDVFQIPEVRESVNIDHLKRHYFTSHPKLNTYSVIPVGGEAWWEQPHDRERFSSSA
uniref:GST C-terminal domain-containing protein n=1 Tax=Auxenochlorella protothecoides TaxID=3075 RepID=A0A1D2AFA8_AUXPR